MLLLGKTQTKHPGDLPTTVLDLLPPPPVYTVISTTDVVGFGHWISQTAVRRIWCDLL